MKKCDEKEEYLLPGSSERKAYGVSFHWRGREGSFGAAGLKVWHCMSGIIGQAAEGRSAAIYYNVVSRTYSVAPCRCGRLPALRL